MTAEVIARMLPLEDRVREVVRTKLVGVFGHQLYQNISAMRKVVSSVPGLRPEDVVHEMSGRAHSEGRRRPKIGRGAFDFRATIAFALVTRPRLAGLDRSVAEVVGRAQELAAGISDLSRLSDASLINRIELVRDDLIRARQVSDVCSFMVGVRDGGYAATALAAISQHGAEFADGANLAEIHDLATRARDDDVVTTLLSGNIEAQTWDLVCANAPHFARATRELLQAVGHCGPTETELANPTYAEEPHLLLKAVASAMKAGDQNVSARDGSTGLGRRRAAMNAKSMARRARARNAVSLTINQMRMALREWGDRLVAVHIVVERDDVYYLTFEELFTVSAAEAGSLVERRRAERARLQGMTFPVRFECEVDADGDWSVPWLTG